MEERGSRLLSVCVAEARAPWVVQVDVGGALAVADAEECHGAGDALEQVREVLAAHRRRRLDESISADEIESC